MKKNLLLYFLISITLYSQMPLEYRAVKLTNVDSDVLASRQNIADAMDLLASVNINIVLPVVWNGGWTLFQSNTMDSLFGKSIDSRYYGRDVLQEVITEAHRVGIEVYPWFEYGFAAWYSGGSAPFGGHILQKHPEWACKTRDGMICTENGFDWMSVINPEVQNFMNNLAMEVVNYYDIDGIEFSDRIPAMPVKGGYEEFTVQKYKEEHNGNQPPSNINDAEWVKWRARQLTNWYNDIASTIRAANPNVFISSSPSQYPWGYENYLQDAKTWLDESIIDHYIPQLYRYNYQDYLYELNKAVALVMPDKKEKLIAGILMNIGVGSNEYVMSADYLSNAVKANRERGVIGEAYFYYEGFRKNNKELANLLRDSFYKEKAAVPGRQIDWRPVAKIMNENDSDASVFGNWQSYPLKGFEGQVFRCADHSAYSSITYELSTENSGVYDIYVFNTPNTTWSKNALYTIYLGDDSVKVITDQSDLSRKGWIKIATFELGEKVVVRIKLDNSLIVQGESLVADAVMMMANRMASPDIISSIPGKVNKELTGNYQFKLEQNYPNPFNPVSEIEYRIVKTGQVNISVYDPLGRAVKTLVNDIKYPGSYRVQFDGSNLASGIYIYRMTAEGYMQSRKMILLR